MLKSPDAIYEGVREAAVNSLREEDPDTEPRSSEIEERVDDLFRDPLAKWIHYREYIDIEIDTDDGTAVVCEQD